MRSQRWLTAACAAMMLLPAAAATWYGPGSYEPDTIYDAQQPWMFPNPDVDPSDGTRKVYFNAFTTAYAVTVPYNSGTLGSRVREFPLLYYEAMLGVWKDCNKDGYIGNVESALLVYPAAAADTSVCPVAPDAVVPHNDGQWVYEFFHIGPTWGSTEDNIAPGILNSSLEGLEEDFEDGAYVWGDPGLPGSEPGQSCPLAPLPHGTSSGTGAFIRWADCLQGLRITGAINAADSNDALGLYFNGCVDNDGQPMTDEECQKNPQKSDSLLNQELPESIFGNPRTGETGTLQIDPETDGESAFTTWDCSDPKGGADVRDPTAAPGERGDLSQVVLDDPTGGQLAAVFGSDGKTYVNATDEEGSYAWLAKPSPQVNNPTWSVAAGVNQTVAGVEDCDDANTYEAGHGTAFFYADGDFEGTVQAPGKNKAQYDFTFADGDPDANNALRGVREGQCGPEGTAAETTCVPGLGERTSRYGGVSRGTWLLREGWSSGIITATAIPQSVNDETGEPVPRSYYAYHAFVHPAVVSVYGLWLPSGSTGTYGSENCATIGPGAPIQKGWVCDPELWNVDAQGKDISEPHFRVVGDPFNLRDIDCYDGTLVRGVGVRASLVDLTEAGACIDAPTS